MSICPAIDKGILHKIIKILKIILKKTKKNYY
jgi:hypothetical protein